MKEREEGWMRQNLVVNVRKIIPYNFKYCKYNMKAEITTIFNDYGNDIPQEPVRHVESDEKMAEPIPHV